MIPWFSLLVWVASIGSAVGFRPSAVPMHSLSTPPATVVPVAGETAVSPGRADARLAERAAIVLG